MHVSVYRVLRGLLVLLACVWLLPSVLWAQKLHTDNKKALAAWQTAYKAFQQAKADVAVASLYQALKHDSTFLEAWYLLADIYAEQQQDKMVIATLNRVIPMESEPSSTSLYMRAKAKRNLGQYLEAVDDLRRYKMAVPTTEQKQHAQLLVETCLFAHRLVSNPVAFRPVNMGPAINSSFDEYWPSITADDSTLVFTRLLKMENRSQEDFYLSRWRDSAWTEARNMGTPANTPFNEGAQSLSADGKTLVFAACGREDGIGSCDLFIAYLGPEGWSVPQNIGSPINTRAWESQPSLSADASKIYFVSNRPGGFGGKDIWVSERRPDGTWNLPHNLGDSINTQHDETSPFLHPDGRTLYFASNGHMGLGLNDVFVARRLPAGQWSRPENLGYPINTPGDERGLITNTQGQLAYVASVRDEGYGGLDLYSFEVPPHIRPTPVTYVKGLVRDADDLRPLQAKVELVSLLDTTVTVVFSHEHDGEFLLILPQGGRYSLNVWRKGYLFYSDHFDLVGQYHVHDPFLLDIRMQPIREGKRLVLKNLFFDTDKSVLKTESTAELEKLLAFLNANASLRVEIGGHTDNQGTEARNRVLSQERAKAVYDYLLQQGIVPARLSFKGYGQSHPIGSNDTADGRAENRRTELRILGE